MRDCRANRVDTASVRGGNGTRAGFAYLDDACPCAGCDDTGSRTHVECVVSVPTSPNDVDDEILVKVLDRRFECSRKEDLGSRCEVIRVSL